MGDDTSRNSDGTDREFDLRKIKWHEVIEICERRSYSSEAERQHRLTQVEWALNRLMPWNDAVFSRINVPSARPSGCKNIDDYRSIREGNLGATLQVRIGMATFWCIPSLLQLSCKYFARQIESVYTFREGVDLTAVGFRAAYDWMRIQKPLDDLNPEQMVELLHTAQQLNMESLENLCCRHVCTTRCSEKFAFEVYLKALKYPKLEAHRKIMLQRVGVHFLAIVGGSEYLEMPIEDMITMLEQDTLGVNSEVEVLFGIVRWLIARPNERCKQMPELMDCVRVTLLPVTMLRRMWSSSLMRNDPSDRIDVLMAAFRNNTKFQERLNNAITVVQMREIYSHRREFVESCRSKNLAVESPREWIYDEECPYHLPQPKGPYCHSITAPNFLYYVSQRAQKAREPPKPTPLSCRGSRPVAQLETIEEVSEDVEQSEAVEPESDNPVSPEQSEGEDETDAHIDQLVHLAGLRELEVIHQQLESLISQADNFINQIEHQSRSHFMNRIELRSRGNFIIPIPLRTRTNGVWVRNTDTSSESDFDASLLSDSSDEVIMRPSARPSNYHSASHQALLNRWDNIISRIGNNNSDTSSESTSDESESYLEQLQSVCEKRKLVPVETEDPTPVEPEIVKPEDQVPPLNDFVQETDRLINELKKQL